MFNTETATAVSKYLHQLVDVLDDCIANDEPEKAVFTVFMLDEAVSPDKPIGILLIRSAMMDRAALLAMGVSPPEVPEIDKARAELKQSLEKWSEG